MSTTVPARKWRSQLSRGRRYFDLYHGTELKPERQGNSWVLSFDLEAKGFGAILALKEPVDDAILS